MIIRPEKSAAGGPGDAVRRARPSLVVRGSLLSGASVAIIMLLVQPKAGPGAFVWNFTPSVPVGLYHIDTSAWVMGDRVAVRPTGRLAGILLRTRVLKPGRLLLKRVAGAGGDTVCRVGADVSVNGAVVAHAEIIDSQGAKLTSWSGCERLGDDQVLLLGEISASFDGRYFGPTDAADIVGRISPVILLPGGHVGGGR